MINAEKLKAARKKQGFVQGYIAQQLGVSVSSYRYKESGKVKFDVSEIAKLAKVLGLGFRDINDIFFGGELTNSTADLQERKFSCDGCPYRFITDAILSRSENVKNGA